MLSKDLPDDKFNLYSEIIKNSSTQLISIIGNILDLSKIEAGIATLEKEVFSVNQILAERFSEFAILSRRKGLKFQLKIRPEDILVRNDKTKFIQILNNLLNNALKFTNNGMISLGYKLEQGVPVYFVSDTGIGIHPDDQSKIFEHFRQLDAGSKREYGGTGIGLSLVKSFLKLMGGQIWVESEPGAGSSFHFMMKDFSEKENSGNAKEADSEPGKALSGKLILVVEDEQVCQEYLRLAISPYDADVITASDGLEAIDLALELPVIDLILLDIKMPGMDGYATLSELKKIHPGTPIIAQTAYAFTDDRAKALAAGFDAFLPKPVKREELILMMSKMLT
jgi:CheY-like chemotaxis protein